MTGKISVAGSRSKSVRLSNIELLRILSMIMVLVIHGFMGALGDPTREEIITTPAFTITRTMMVACCVGATNVFVLISGWFGINFRWKSLAKLLFQCFFFSFGILVVLKALNLIDLGIVKGIYRCLFLKAGDAWFVKAYIGMFIFAPVLNSFVQYATKRQIEFVLVSFYLFQTIYGWITNGAPFFEMGFSSISFMGLYILARYVRIYKPFWTKYKIHNDAIIYITTTLVIFAIMLGSSYFQYSSIFFLCHKNTSPFTIIAALYLLLIFSKFSFTNKFINNVASSCFAVFLMHFMIFNKYIYTSINFIAHNYSYLPSIFLIFLLLLVFFTVSILIDKVRLFCWNKLALLIDR